VRKRQKKKNAKKQGPAIARREMKFIVGPWYVIDTAPYSGPPFQYMVTKVDHKNKVVTIKVLDGDS